MFGLGKNTDKLQKVAIFRNLAVEYSAYLYNPYAEERKELDDWITEVNKVSGRGELTVQELGVLTLNGVVVDGMLQRKSDQESRIITEVPKA